MKLAINRQVVTNQMSKMKIVMNTIRKHLMITEFALRATLETYLEHPSWNMI
jgi:hypothetical protein